MHQLCRSTHSIHDAVTIHYTMTSGSFPGGMRLQIHAALLCPCNCESPTCELELPCFLNQPSVSGHATDHPPTMPHQKTNKYMLTNPTIVDRRPSARHTLSAHIVTRLLWSPEGPKIETRSGPNLRGTHCRLPSRWVQIEVRKGTHIVGPPTWS